MHLKIFLGTEARIAYQLLWKVAYYRVLLHEQYNLREQIFSKFDNKRMIQYIAITNSIAITNFGF